MVAKDICEKGLEGVKNFPIRAVLPALRLANEGAIDDVLNTNGCAYYQWLPCAIDYIKPRQIVELGGAMGVSAIMMLQSKWQDYKLYSITLPEHGLEFSYIADDYPNLIKVIGNDLDLSSWPKELDFKKTDLWFVDSEHSYEQVKKELELYGPMFKKGAVVLFDDIHINDGLQKIWDEIEWDKFDATDPLHFSGFGVCVV